MNDNKRLGNDIFAKIAVQRFEYRSKELFEPKPLPIPKNILPLSGENRLKGFRPRPKMTTQIQLQRELEKYRKRYTKFMLDLAPKLNSCRITMPLHRFDWRVETKADRKNFRNVLDGGGKWRKVKIPHYGPPLGRAVTYYRTIFKTTRKMFEKGSLFICFDGVDYKAHVFVNDIYLGSHEGFFAPFEFEFTPHAHLGLNTLVIKVENDAPMMGSSFIKKGFDGNKIYAATGCGYDDPQLGWHHCPPAMGIYQDVRIEARPRLFIHDTFVRPIPEKNESEAWVEIWNCDTTDKPVTLDLSLYGQNFRKTVFKGRLCKPRTAQIRGHGDVDQFNNPSVEERMGPDVNYLRIPMKISHPRRWEPNSPWLYQLQVKLLDENGRIIDAAKQQFGLRSFLQDEKSEPKGKIYLNGREICLRGANTMGNLQQCVMRQDYDQLCDDILLAKICHMNFLRLTQRPVQKQIYEYCDRLGMMTQTDLPLFGVLRRNQMIEAIRQSEEMERLVRSHACNILVSYINEPYPNATGKPHRFLIREELEDFFDMASKVIRRTNPDRVIKYCDGDYDPPAGAGMPDNHCYCGWYIGSGLDLGKLNRGYWIPVKKGWHYGCGEFGSEGLDSYEVMKKYYPLKWLPKSLTSPWSPSVISMAQSGRFHYLWYETPKTAQEWIDASQNHQAWITRLMTEAFRRDSRMNSFAIHLFIDAWPSGWMKAIMDVDRQPKKAFFVYRDALTPLMVSLRCDRTTFWSDETMELEAWVCNDTHHIPYHAKLLYQLEMNGTLLQAGQCKAHIQACDSKPQGIILFKAPQVQHRSKVICRLALADGQGKILHDTCVWFSIFPVNQIKLQRRFFVPEGLQNKAARLARQLAANFVYKGALKQDDVILISNPALPQKQIRDIEQAVHAGAIAVYLELQPGVYHIASSKVKVTECGMGQRHFVSRDTKHPLVNGFEPEDFKFWYNCSVGYPTPILESVVQAKGWDVILQSANGSWESDWRPVPVALEKRAGKGFFRICQIKLGDQIQHNPVARIFLEILFSQDR